MFEENDIGKESQYKVKSRPSKFYHIIFCTFTQVCEKGKRKRKRNTINTKYFYSGFSLGWDIPSDF